MDINSTVKGFFLKIAKRLGFELAAKSNTNQSYNALGLNPTAIGAAVIANIAIDDSDIIIDGTNARAAALRELKDYFTDEIETVAAEVSLGTGDCIVRPYTDGKHIGLNVIGNDSFIVTESIGTYLKGIIMKLDEYRTDSNIYRLFECQTLKEQDDKSFIYIRRFAYKNERELDFSLTHWKNMPDEECITADQLLLGRYKCPTVNRSDYNSANGVPITFGCEEIIESIKTKYRQYNEEFDRKQVKTFADRTLFNTTKDKKNGGNRLTLDGHQFITLSGDMNNGVGSLIQDYSPAIRETDFKAANNFNLSMLELCCGFSKGIFTSPETAFTTATEMVQSLKKTFSFVKRFRRRIELGNQMLFGALNIIMNLNGTTPLGEWKISHNWSYDYIEQTAERFNQLLQAHSAGAVKTEDLTAWVLNLDEEKAKKYVAELKAIAKEERNENNNFNFDGID